ncbi:MAG: hypothetical protein U5Q03_17910 [Bacteroidota bacterium]|nr:hypothetical protein [Bacteroidota bacterium]
MLENINCDFVFDTADLENGSKICRALTIPYSNIRIQYTKDGSDLYLETFTITDGKGVIYRFNDKETIYTNSYVEARQEETEDENTTGAYTIVSQSKGSYTVNWLLSENNTQWRDSHFYLRFRKDCFG